MQPFVLSGVLGRPYEYHAFYPPVTWLDHPGNYVFVAQRISGFQVLYVGESESIRDRLTNHDRWREAQSLGANVILMHFNFGGIGVRQYEERDLIARYNPPLNKQHRRLAELARQNPFSEAAGPGLLSLRDLAFPPKSR